jgi:hypothetical protein
MNKNPLVPNGWSLVALSTLMLALVMGSIAIVHGIDESSLRIAIRSTARISVVLFLSTFIATAVRKLYPGQMSFLLLQEVY